MATRAAPPPTARISRNPFWEGAAKTPNEVVVCARAAPATALAIEVPMARIKVLRLLAAAVSDTGTALLRDSDDPKLVAGAVEELLRYLNITHNGRRRVALADIEIAGQVIRAGDGLIIANDIANRDPAVFEEPDRLDLRRDARHHVAFGFGVHQCLGQPLARMELQVVYRTLYKRIPTLRLATTLDRIPFKHDGSVYGVYELPVTW
jgi:cytochrome P450